MRMLKHVILAGIMVHLLTSTSYAMSRYGVTCIANRTTIQLNLQYRWGNESWRNLSADPGSTFRFWYEYTPGSVSSEPLQIYLDVDANAHSAEWKTFDLARYQSPDNTCKNAKFYEFIIQQGGAIRILSQN